MICRINKRYMRKIFQKIKVKICKLSIKYNKKFINFKKLLKFCKKSKKQNPMKIKNCLKILPKDRKLI
jgi:hypothetical protein